MNRSLLAAIVFLGACGGNSHRAAEDAGVDAMVDAPDVFDPCPGLATFQVGVVDWENAGQNLVGVRVEEVGTGRSGSSAPNGRVLVCVAPEGPVVLRFSESDLVDRIHTSSGEQIAAHYATNQVLNVRMMRPDQLDSLHADVLTPREVSQSTVIAIALEVGSGSPMADVQISLDVDNDGAFTPNANTLKAGSLTKADGRVVFLNATPTTAALLSNNTECLGGASVVLEAGTISSTTLACTP